MANEFQIIRCGCNKVVGELESGKGRYTCRNCKATTVAKIEKGKVVIVEFIEPADKVDRIRLFGEVSDPYQERLGLNRK